MKFRFKKQFTIAKGLEPKFIKIVQQKNTVALYKKDFGSQLPKGKARSKFSLILEKNLCWCGWVLKDSTPLKHFLLILARCRLQLAEFLNALAAARSNNLSSTGILGAIRCCDNERMERGKGRRCGRVV